MVESGPLGVISTESTGVARHLPHLIRTRPRVRGADMSLRVIADIRRILLYTRKLTSETCTVMSGKGPIGDIAGSVGPLPATTTRRNCQVLLASFECFYSKYRWQVARDFLPIFTFI